MAYWNWKRDLKDRLQTAAPLKGEHMWDRLSHCAKARCALNHVCFVVFCLETFVSVSDLWAKDGKDSSHVFEIHFQTPHSYIFSLHRSAVCQNYLFAWFYDGNTGNMFFALTINQNPGTAIRILFFCCFLILNCLSGHLWTSELWHIGCSWCRNHVRHQKELFCYWRQRPSGSLHDCPWARCGCPLVNTKQLFSWFDLS